MVPSRRVPPRRQRYDSGCVLSCGLFLLLLQASLAAADCTPAELKALLIADADSIGFATSRIARNDYATTTLANTVQVGPDYLQSRGTVSRDQFLGTWADVIEGIQYIPDPAIKEKWEYRRDKLLIPKETIPYDDPNFTAFFTDMITDGLMGANGPLTEADVTQRTTRAGSWAERRCGRRLTINDVSAALNLP
jgi:hypothetical protein